MKRAFLGALLVVDYSNRELSIVTLEMYGDVKCDDGGQRMRVVEVNIEAR